MKTKYALIKKESKGWIRCAIWEDTFKPIPDNMTEDKALVKQNRDKMRQDFPTEKYAILKITF